MTNSKPGSTLSRQENEELLMLLLEKRRRRWVTDPTTWVEDKLNEHLWSRQRQIVEAVVQHRRVAVPSAHATGKSFLASRLVAWWIDTHPPGESFVVTTATTGAQVRGILWREIHRAHSRGNLEGRLNQTEWWINDEMVAFGRKPADYEPTAFQGIHARYVLVVLDEACGIPSQLWQAAGSLAANEHSRILAIGNPDDPSSHFAQVCTPDSGWTVMPVSGLSSPNFTGEDVPEALKDVLISRIYTEELAQDVGEDSAVYKSKVLGEFPEDASDGVIPLSMLRACQRLDRTYTPESLVPVELGVDVGAGGDETVIRERRGPKVGRSWGRKTPDWAQGVAMVLNAIDVTGATAVKVDMIGVGWGIVGRLKELKSEGRITCTIHGVNVGEGSTQPEKFPRLRDQIWWEVGRGLSQSHGWDLTDVEEKVVAQLIAPEYHRDSAGRIKIESKDDTKKRIRRSPDDADALLLAYFVPQKAQINIRSIDIAPTPQKHDFKRPGRYADHPTQGRESSWREWR